MKSLLRRLALLALIFTVLPALSRGQDQPPPPDQGSDPGQDASFQTFYDQLGSQGNWIQTDNYGYVFQPNVQDPNWAPYTDGHWVYTDDGWAWVSDEPWGWATYHYGRWANIDGTGWVWVPGNQWAPAWVSWRYGGGYAGWAPLPPEAEYGDGADFHFGGDVDVSFGIGAGLYNFVPIGHMGDGNYRGFYANRDRNYTIINRTTNVTNINIRNGRGGFGGVNAGGPRFEDVNAHAQTHIQRVQLARANQVGPGRVQGNQLAVYAPRFNPASKAQARPTNVGGNLGRPEFNRGDSVQRPLQVTRSIQATAPSAQAIQEARTAQAHAPASAHIATAKNSKIHLNTTASEAAKPATTPDRAAAEAPKQGQGQAAVNGQREQDEAKQHQAQAASEQSERQQKADQAASATREQQKAQDASQEREHQQASQDAENKSEQHEAAQKSEQHEAAQHEAQPKPEEHQAQPQHEQAQHEQAQHQPQQQQHQAPAQKSAPAAQKSDNKSQQNH